jgi:hypothetical protein
MQTVGCSAIFFLSSYDDTATILTGLQQVSRVMYKNVDTVMNFTSFCTLSGDLDMMDHSRV